MYLKNSNDEIEGGPVFDPRPNSILSLFRKCTDFSRMYTLYIIHTKAIIFYAQYLECRVLKKCLK